MSSFDRQQATKASAERRRLDIVDGGEVPATWHRALTRGLSARSTIIDGMQKDRPRSRYGSRLSLHGNFLRSPTRSRRVHAPARRCVALMGAVRYAGETACDSG